MFMHAGIYISGIYNRMAAEKFAGQLKERNNALVFQLVNGI